jgi:hypothetical protein
MCFVEITGFVSAKAKKKKVFVVFFFLLNPMVVNCIGFFFSFYNCNCMLTWLVIGHLCWKGQF